MSQSYSGAYVVVVNRVAPVLLSVVIPTRNRPELLGSCLDALFEQTLDPSRYEVIVVDDASSPPVAPRDPDRHARCGLTFMASSAATPSGPAAARNAGAARACGDLLLFLDDDVIAETDLLERHLDAHADDPDVVIIGNLRLQPLPGLNVPPGLTARLTQRQQRLSTAEPNRFDLLSGHFSIRRRVFHQLRGFDESLPRHEDYEFGRRAIAAGVPMLYCADARAVEIYSRSTDLYLFDAYCRGISQGRLVARRSAVPADFQLDRFFRGSYLARAARRALWLSLSSNVARRAINATSRSQRWKTLGPRLPGILPAVAAVNFWSGVFDAFGSIRRFRTAVLPELLVLGYHIVDDDVAGTLRRYAVSPEQFSQQMSGLAAAGYTAVSLEQWRDVSLGLHVTPSRPLLITFDDADERTLRNAWPILRQNGLTATVFVPAELVGGRNEWDSAMGAHRRSIAGAEYLKQLAAEGAELGCHGALHRSLPGLTDTELERETAGARRTLEELIDRPVRFFALPFGNADRRTWAALAAAGYSGVCTSRSGLNRLGSDLFRIRRIFVQSRDAGLWFRLRVRFARQATVTNIRFAFYWFRSALRRLAPHARS